MAKLKPTPSLLTKMHICSGKGLPVHINDGIFLQITFQLTNKFLRAAKITDICAGKKKHV